MKDGEARRNHGAGLFRVCDHDDRHQQHRGRPRTTAATAGLSQGDVSDYIALLKPRVMFLVVFTALVGMVVAPLGVHPVVAFAVAPHDRRRRRRLRLPQHVVGRGYRRPDDAHPPAPDPGRQDRPGRGARLRAHPRRRLGPGARPRRQLARRRPARLHDLLLRRRLLDVAEAHDAAEHRHRRRRRRPPAGRGAGGGDRRASASTASSSSPSSSSGRRRISGRSRS